MMKYDKINRKCICIFMFTRKFIYVKEFDLKISVHVDLASSIEPLSKISINKTYLNNIYIYLQCFLLFII